MKAVYKKSGESIEDLIYRFKKQVRTEKILEEYRKREAYMKPGERKKAKHNAVLKKIRRSRRFRGVRQSATR